MKKFIFSLIIFLMPFVVDAVTPNFNVVGYFSDMSINTDGSITVKEAFVLNGSFNGYERIIKTENSNISRGSTINLEGDAAYNPKGIENIKVAAFLSNYEDRSVLDRVKEYSTYSENPTIGDSNVYTEINYENSKYLRSYYSCSNCEVAFYYEYTLKDVVVLHNDIAEVYYQLFSAEDITEDLNRLDIKVNFPEDDSDALMWVHGNVYGSVTRNDKHSFVIECDDFPEASMLDFRTVFNKQSINNDLLENSGIDALSKIKDIEAERDRVRQEEIDNVLKTIKLLNVLDILYAIGFIIIMIYVYNKYDKEFKVDFDMKYNREFIDEYDVEIVEYLMKRNITSNAMSASIMNMIYKKNIEAEPIDDKKKDYKFTLISRDGLSENENKLVDFLFEEVGDGTIYTTKQLKSYAKSSSTYDSFNSSYRTWCDSVTADAQKEGFYLNLFGVKFRTLLYIGLGIFLVWCNVMIRVDYLTLWIVSFIVLVIAAIYVLSFIKRTKRGALHYRKWLAFKNFLNDFGTFELKELPEVVLWEKYLVYATVFGLAKKVQKVMNVKIQELDSTFLQSDYYYHFDSFVAINNVVNTSIYSAHDLAITQAAASNLSNSSGTGGGFSSGGGFGGGGGGGHGF